MKNRTKLMLVAIGLMASISNVSAQDLIVLNNDDVEELQVKVIEVSESAVKYKKWSYQDGPIFTLSTNKILYIKYQNGEKQRFGILTESAKPAEEATLASATSKPQSEKVFTKQPEVLPKTKEEKAEKYFSRQKNSWQLAGSFNYVIPDSAGEYEESFFLAMDYLGRYNVIDGLNVYAGLGFMTGYFALGGGYMDRITISESTIYLPLGVGYNLPLGNLFSLDFTTGPRLNYIVAGSIEENNVKYKYKELGNVERFNANWGIGAAVMVANYGVKFEYSIGISDTADDYFKIGLNILF